MNLVIELNTNILETNLINILLLLGLLFYVNKVSFSVSLKERQNEISQNFDKAEKEISLALNYYKEVEQSYQENYLYLELWKKDYESEKVKAIDMKYEGIKKNLKELFLTSKTLVKSFENKNTLSLQTYLIIFTVGKLLKKFFNLSKEEKSNLTKSIILNL
jgi:F0F1-type ATP synthase membrane subunit b/b'